MIGRIHPMGKRVVLAGILAGIAVVGLATGAAAADDVTVSASPVAIAPGDDGAHTVSVAIVNDGPDLVVRGSVRGDADCTVVAAPDKIDAGRSATVTFTLDRNCAVDDDPLTLVIRDRNDSDELLGVVTTEDPSSPTPDWDILGLAAAWAAAAAAVTVLVIVHRLTDVKARVTSPDAVRQRTHERNRALARANAAREVLDREPVPIPATPVAVTFGWGTPLQGSTTGWSFSNWVSNVTIGASALVAIVAATGVLETLLGDDADAVIGLVAVVAAITAVLVTLGPLVLKAFGPDVDKPTLGGTVVAVAVVMLGTYFQIAALTTQAARLVEEEALQGAIAAAGLVVALMVLTYAVRSIPAVVEAGMKPLPPSVSPQERAAWIVFRALNPTTTLPPFTPLDLAELEASLPPEDDTTDEIPAVVIEALLAIGAERDRAVRSPLP